MIGEEAVSTRTTFEAVPNIALAKHAAATLHQYTRYLEGRDSSSRNIGCKALCTIPVSLSSVGVHMLGSVPSEGIHECATGVDVTESSGPHNKSEFNHAICTSVNNTRYLDWVPLCCR